ncbi:MAG: electron transport complex subunit RsxB [Gammaproteobacteria bacterium]|nr:electron transport complex subunit RsxB [Gammaproteobacteria bacterium]
MDALASTTWFVALVRVVATLLLLYLGWRGFVCLRTASQRSRRREASEQPQRSLIETIELLLPQTQCGQCGYAGCAPYAEAIAKGDAINRCPPGGDRTIRQLANLMQLPVVSLNPEHGSITAPSVAFIREAECIGCTKCIQACPVDAIVGAAKLMHTVITSECTGCDLCFEPCPVDCIDMLPAPEPIATHWKLPLSDASPSADSLQGLPT